LRISAAHSITPEAAALKATLDAAPAGSPIRSFAAFLVALATRLDWTESR
jgi:hypothetical protein